MTMPGKAHHRKPRPDDWSQAMTWTIRIEEIPGDRRRRAALLDRALRLSQLERRRLLPTDPDATPTDQH